MKKLKIAMLASNLIKIPPTPKDIPSGFSGAPESVVYLLVEELVKRGHDVTLFASGNSKTSAKLVSVTDKDVSTLYDISKIDHKEFEHLLISKAYQMANKGKFDIIHSHFDTRSLFYSQFTKVPTIVTLHSPLNDVVKNKILGTHNNTQNYVSISNSQRKPLPKIKYVKTIYHGVDVDKLPYAKNKGEYLVFVGRLNSEKGADLAVRIAKKAGKKLLLLGYATDANFYKEYIKPYLSKDIIHLGFLSHNKVLDLVSKAQGLILPLRWEEPFGLVMIEALGCGTPVVAFDRGSASEIIKDDKNGFLIKEKTVGSNLSVDKFVKAINKLPLLDTNYCRIYVKNKFSIAKMIDSYESVYYKLLRGKNV